MFKEVITQSIDYILNHLDEEITVEEVAAYCHFSKYYFGRVFKAETGESIYAFIKRLKMEQSAMRLRLEKEKSVSDIGLAYGYSASNFSTAFKKHHHLSPQEFRKNLLSSSPSHPYNPERPVKVRSFEEYDRQIQIKELADFRVIFERHIGSYPEQKEKWPEFLEKYQTYVRADTLLIKRSFNDPSVTDARRCLYDLCITVDASCPLKNVTRIPGGKFAVYPFEGLIPDIYTAAQGVFHIWLPNSDYCLDDRFIFNIYRAVDPARMWLTLDICIPVQDQGPRREKICKSGKKSNYKKSKFRKKSNYSEEKKRTFFYNEKSHL